MTTIRIGPFLGVKLAPKPHLLDPGIGVACSNANPERGDLQPWKQPLTVAACGGSAKTLFPLPRDAVTDTLYFLEWTTRVHVVRGFRDVDDSTKRMYYTGDGAPKSTDTTLALAGAPYPTSYRDLGIPLPATVPTVTQNVAGTGSDETRFYAYTYVSDWDEEGPPAVSAAFTCKPGAQLTISNLAPPPSGAGESRGINRIRLYRTVAGDAGADFFLLSEIALATSTTDNALPVQSDVLTTTKYQKPPTNLKCLVELPNNFMAGISGKTIRYCEVNRPHAWPTAYVTRVSDQPIALAVYGSTLLALTTGKPRMIQGRSPEAMDDAPVEMNLPCVSEPSVVTFEHGVAWASAEGAAYVGAGGPRLLTDGMFTPKQWRALNPETMVGAQYAGLYFLFYNDAGTWKGIYFDPLRPEAGFRSLTTGYQAAVYDRLSQKLYVRETTNVREWDGGASDMTADFTSKVFRMQAPTNLSLGEVISTTYPVTLTVYPDALGPFVITVPDRQQFTLPGGFMADDYQVKVAGSGVEGVVLTDTLSELAQT